MFLYGSFRGCNGGEEKGEGGKKAQGFGLLCGRRGGEPACQYPASASPPPSSLGIYRSQGYLQRGKGGGGGLRGVEGGISGLVVARGNHAKKKSVWMGDALSDLER